MKSKIVFASNFASKTMLKKSTNAMKVVVSHLNRMGTVLLANAGESNH